MRNSLGRPRKRNSLSSGIPVNTTKYKDLPTIPATAALPKACDRCQNHGDSGRPFALPGKAPSIFASSATSSAGKLRRSQSLSPARDSFAGHAPTRSPSTMQRGRFWLAPLLSEGGDLGEEACGRSACGPTFSRQGLESRGERWKGQKRHAACRVSQSAFVCSWFAVRRSGTGNADDLLRRQAVRWMGAHIGIGDKRLHADGGRLIASRQG